MCDYLKFAPFRVLLIGTGVPRQENGESAAMRYRIWVQNEETINGENHLRVVYPFLIAIERVAGILNSALESQRRLLKFCL